MEALTPIQQVLVVISGLLVGFILGLIGGGGSILAVPLLLYFVGYNHPHIVIGTTAIENPVLLEHIVDEFGLTVIDATQPLVQQLSGLEHQANFP